MFGLQATKPGMKEIVITKPNFNFKNIEGEFPTPHGLVSVNWEIKNKSILNIKVPKGIIAKIDIESLNNNKTIKLNHKTLCPPVIARYTSAKISESIKAP